ncbi:MAG: hypothetical protein V7768_14540, partial [Dietzia cercidiphylli]
MRAPLGWGLRIGWVYRAVQDNQATGSRAGPTDADDPARGGGVVDFRCAGTGGADRQGRMAAAALLR